MEIPRRGPFEFGPPYNTLGIRVTNEDDGEILPRTYPYWPSINAHRGREVLRVLLGTSRGPCTWEVNKCSHVVTPLGPLFAPDHTLAASTAEGWYWDWHDPHVLYCSDDTHLYRYDVEAGVLTPVVDITPLAWLGRYALRQWHTSARRRHSATVKQVVDDGAWPNIGTIVYDEEARQPWTWFPKRGPLDESQIDRAGDYVLIKENVDGLDDEDNRIITLATGCERVLLDRQGAGGHSDNGFGLQVAADNWRSEATWRVWMFDQSQRPQGRIILTTPWDSQVIHVSYCHARPGSLENQWVLGSGTCPDLLMIPLDGSRAVRPIAPSMSAGESYDDLAKANTDSHALYALWTARRDGRFDAFMVKIP